MEPINFKRSSARFAKRIRSRTIAALIHQPLPNKSQQLRRRPLTLVKSKHLLLTKLYAKPLLREPTGQYQRIGIVNPFAKRSFPLCLRAGKHRQANCVLRHARQCLRRNPVRFNQQACYQQACFCVAISCFGNCIDKCFVNEVRDQESMCRPSSQVTPRILIGIPIKLFPNPLAAFMPMRSNLNRQPLQLRHPSNQRAPYSSLPCPAPAPRNHQHGHS
jgi:hypothetical protein